jgi:hypothetical protein
VDGRPDERRIHGSIDSERCDADDDIPEQDFLLGDMAVEHFARHPIPRKTGHTFLLAILDTETGGFRTKGVIDLQINDTAD